MPPENLVLALVGFMGSGKTTLGRELARLLEVPFRDLDARIEEESGLTVPEWFARRGEPAFREAERAALVVDGYRAAKTAHDDLGGEVGERVRGFQEASERCGGRLAWPSS